MKKQTTITLIMLAVLILGLFTVTGCGGCLSSLRSCLFPSCDGEPDGADELFPVVMLGMDYTNCCGSCLEECLGCQMMGYSDSELMDCLGCYDISYYGCVNCQAVDNANIWDPSIEVNVTEIMCDSCYCVNIVDDDDFYAGGCMFK